MEISAFREFTGLAIAVVSLLLIFNARVFKRKHQTIATIALIYVEIMLILVAYYRL